MAFKLSTFLSGSDSAPCSTNAGHEEVEQVRTLVVLVSLLCSLLR